MCLSRLVTSLSAMPKEYELQLPIIIHNENKAALSKIQLTHSINKNNIFMISHTPLSIHREINPQSTYSPLGKSINKAAYEIKQFNFYKSAALMIRANLKKKNNIAKKPLRNIKAVSNSYASLLQILPKRIESGLKMATSTSIKRDTSAQNIIQKHSPIKDELCLTLKHIRGFRSTQSKITVNIKKSLETVGSTMPLYFTTPKARACNIFTANKNPAEEKSPINIVETINTSEEPNKSAQQNVSSKAADIPIIDCQNFEQVLEMLKQHSSHLINSVFTIINDISCFHLRAKIFIISNSHEIEFGKAASICNEKGVIYLNSIDNKANIRNISEQLLQLQFKVINFLNQYTPTICPSYKYYIGKGNNYLLVRSVMQARWWWNTVAKSDIIHANFSWTQSINKRYHQLIGQTSPIVRVSNHLPCHYQISNKKSLFINIKKFYEEIHQNPYDFIPVTYHLRDKDDPEINNFITYFCKCSDKLWIVKPGENTNRGKGIVLIDSISQLMELMNDGENCHTYIIQKYIEKPLLINKRKFDIRCFALITSINNHIKAFYYKEGYVRTSSSLFNIKDLNNKYIHLTNDAIQKTHMSYGKFENGNKLSYGDLSKILKLDYNKVQLKIKSIVTDAINATYKLLDPHQIKHSFEIFGFDFMIDEDLKVYLIEVNTNPCLETSCPLLSNIIPTMLENCFRIVLDPMFPPPSNFMSDKRAKCDYIPENKMELIIDGDLAIL